MGGAVTLQTRQKIAWMGYIYRSSERERDLTHGKGGNNARKSAMVQVMEMRFSLGSGRTGGACG